MADDEERIDCPYCERDYSSQGYLDNHIEKDHPEEMGQESEPLTAEDDPEPTVNDPSGSCDNHPERLAIGRTDGVKASVVYYCPECERKYA